MGRRVMVVGGGYAGMLCAMRLARKTHARDVSVVLVDPRAWFTERIRLHQDVAGGWLPRRSYGAMLAGTNVEHLRGWARGFDFEHRRATIELEGKTSAEPFDDLVIAAGSVARDPPEAALPCATEKDASAVKRRLDALAPGARIVVVGGGLSGLELASELGERRKDFKVTLITEGEVVETTSVGRRQHARDVLGRLGVTLVEHERVVSVDRSEVIVASGAAIASDLTVWCGGFAASPLGRAAGLLVDELGRAIVDPYCRSLGHDFVHVAGDAARMERVRNDGTTAPLGMACASAMPMGAFVADDIAGEVSGRARRPFSFDWFVRCISLGRADAIVQKVDRDDRPTRLCLDGALGAWFKEQVCRFTMTAISLEKKGIPYVWPKSRPVPRVEAPLLGGAE